MFATCDYFATALATNKCGTDAPTYGVAYGVAPAGAVVVPVVAGLLVVPVVVVVV